MANTISPLAGQPAPLSMRLDVEKLITAYQPDDPSHTAELNLGIHNARLHLTIPPGMEAARTAAKEMGAHWDAKNKRWTDEVVANSVNLVENGLPRVAAAIHAAEQSQTLAKSITASDPRIGVSFEGDTVFVRTPNMPSANQELKGAGFTWRDRQSAYGVVPLSVEVVLALDGLPSSFHGDPADRLIVATARAYTMPLATHDTAIRRSRAARLWKP